MSLYRTVVLWFRGVNMTAQEKKEIMTKSNKSNGRSPCWRQKLLENTRVKGTSSILYNMCFVTSSHAPAVPFVQPSLPLTFLIKHALFDRVQVSWWCLSSVYGLVMVWSSYGMVPRYGKKATRKDCMKRFAQRMESLNWKDHFTTWNCKRRRRTRLRKHFTKSRKFCKSARTGQLETKKH